MKALVLVRPGEAAVTDVAAPAGDGRAVVAPDTLGLCGTDLKILSGAIPVETPRILGHEIVGRVVRPGRLGLPAEGRRVLVNPALSCGACRLCRADRPHLCGTGALMGRDVDGGFAELVAVDEDRLHPVPEDLSPEAASVLQVLGTCVHAQTLVDVFPGRSSAVIGLGVGGLLHLQLLRARGVDRVVGVTRSEWKRRLADELGAVATAAPEEAGDVVADITDGAGADLVVEAAGSVPSLAQAIELAAVGGTVLAFGITSPGPARFPFYQLYYKEIDLVSARSARPRDYDRAIELAASGALRLRPLWSAGFPLEEAGRALDAARDGSALKVSLTVPDG